MKTRNHDRALETPDTARIRRLAMAGRISGAFYFQRKEEETWLASVKLHPQSGWPQVAPPEGGSSLGKSH